MDAELKTLACNPGRYFGSLGFMELVKGKDSKMAHKNGKMIFPGVSDCDLVVRFEHSIGIYM
ncbi:unnamed protein product [Sphenostylis stenocarpa]|uniref:Uncharacterized protein n=1 Tax=Sphenostylis stenocarpa TaxID=92480 RepID=A0AA86W466_9FABA|nr:unnamed protein product [Sphenostylis stenocarpa]